MRKVILTILAVALPAFAFWPAGGVKVVQTPESISNPQMIYVNDGSVVISWEADRQIYCQKLDTTGIIHWDAEGIRVCLSDSNQRDHHMVTDGEDVWFVWQDERNDDGDIYAQKIEGTTGQRLWVDEGITVCEKEGQQFLQKSTVLLDGSFIATWSDYGVDPYDVGVQRLNSNGQAQWTSNGINIVKGKVGGYKSTVLPSGSAVLDVWVDRNLGDTVSAYFAQRIDSAGNFIWDTLGVLVEHAVHFYGVCSDGSGGGVVLFTTPVTFKLAVQHVDSSGNVRWNSGGIILNESSANTLGLLNSSYEAQGFASDGLGGCFVWWRDTDASLRVQHVDSTGGKVWGFNGTAYWTREAYYEGPLVATKLCSDGNNGVFAVYDNLEWGDSLDPTIDLGVLVQRINAVGQPVFDSNGVVVRQWPRDIDALPWGRFLSAAAAVPGGVILTWGDNRDESDYSLYAQIVDTTGKVGSGIEEENLHPIPLPVLELVSSISSGVVTLKYLLPANQTGTLKLFEVSGRLIKSLTLNQRAGVITLNTQDLPSGVYFAELRSEGARVRRKVVVIK